MFWTNFIVYISIKKCSFTPKKKKSLDCNIYERSYFESKRMMRKIKLKNKILVDRPSKPTVQAECDQEIKWTNWKIHCVLAIWPFNEHQMDQIDRYIVLAFQWAHFSKDRWECVGTSELRWVLTQARSVLLQQDSYRMCCFFRKTREMRLFQSPLANYRLTAKTCF